MSRRKALPLKERADVLWNLCAAWNSLDGTDIPDDVRRGILHWLRVAVRDAPEGACPGCGLEQALERIDAAGDNVQPLARKP